MVNKNNKLFDKNEKLCALLFKNNTIKQLNKQTKQTNNILNNAV